MACPLYRIGLTPAPRRAACAYLLLVLFLLPAGAAAQRLPIRTYTTNDGLASDRIYRIVQDPHGFLWFCTANGLSRFDGERFASYTTETGLPYHAINDLLITRDGRYLLASNGAGVVAFDVSPRGSTVDASRVRGAVQSTIDAWRFRAYRVGRYGATNRVNVLLEDRQGRIWAGTDGGLFVLERWEEPLRFTRVPLIGLTEEWSVIVYAFAEGQDGGLWLGTAAGLTRRLPDGRFVHYRWAGQGGGVVALVHDRAGRLWAGQNYGLSVIMPEPAAALEVASGSIVRYRAPDQETGGNPLPLPDAPGEVGVWTEAHGIPVSVRGLTVASDGHVWLAGVGRLMEFDGQQLRFYEAPVGRLWATPLLQDADGHIWTATSGNGAIRFARSGFLTFPNTHRAEGAFATAFETRDGQVCAFTQNGTLSCFTGRRFIEVASAFAWKEGWPGAAAVVEDRDRRWWVASAHGLRRYPSGLRLSELPRARPVQTYAARDGLPEDNIARVYEDVRGDIWMATWLTNRRVLARWERAANRLVIYSDADGLSPYNGPWSFAEDRAGALWIGFREGGVVRYQNGRFLRLRERHGIPPGDRVSVHVDLSGRLWVATSGGGVLRVDRPEHLPLKGIRYTTAEGLASNHVLCVTEDNRGRIYLGTLNGLNRLDPTTGDIKRYTQSDGLISNQIDVRAFRDQDGALWFHSDAGLSRFVPGPERPARVPHVAIDGVMVGDRSLRLSALGEAEVHLGTVAATVPLQIDFVGSGFGTGGSLRYQYKLEGAGEDWERATFERHVRYARFAPGRYRFLVRAVNPNGVVSPRAASVTFRVLPPIWLRWWFLGLAGVAGMLVVYGAHRHRVGQLLELERVRSRIATDLHDEVGSSLSQIAVLSEVARRRLSNGGDGVSEPLARIADVSRESVDAMSEIVWAIDPERDSIVALEYRMRRFANDVLSTRDITVRFPTSAAAEGVSADAHIRRDVFLIFKEAVNNIARHAGATDVRIELEVRRQMLTLTVNDNGKGLNGGELSRGVGLRSMRERANRLRGHIDITSPNGAGTCVRLTVPLTRSQQSVTRFLPRKS